MYKKEAEEINEVHQKTELNKSELEPEPEIKPIKIVHGYSRDKRPDLKQFIIDMIVTGDGDVPLYLKIDSGNVDGVKVAIFAFCRHASSENHTQTMFQKKNDFNQKIRIWQTRSATFIRTI